MLEFICMIVPVSLFCVSYDILYVIVPASYAVRQFFVCCYMFTYNMRIVRQFLHCETVLCASLCVYLLTTCVLKDRQFNSFIICRLFHHL